MDYYRSTSVSFQIVLGMANHSYLKVGKVTFGKVTHGCCKLPRGLPASDDLSSLHVLEAGCSEYRALLAYTTHECLSHIWVTQDDTGHTDHWNLPQLRVKRESSHQDIPQEAYLTTHVPSSVALVYNPLRAIIQEVKHFIMWPKSWYVFLFEEPDTEPYIHVNMYCIHMLLNHSQHSWLYIGIYIYMHI